MLVSFCLGGRGYSWCIAQGYNSNYYIDRQKPASLRIAATSRKIRVNLDGLLLRLEVRG